MTDAGPDQPGSWEQRWHPLREEWVIVAAHRQQRPWTGKTVAAAAAELPAYDPACYLCPGNARVGGRGQRPLRDHVRVRQRSPVRGPGRAARGRRPAAALPRVARRRRRARRVLLAAPRSDAGRDAAVGDRRGRRRVARPDARAGRAPGGSPGVVLREQGRRRRRLQSAPARPDLRDVVRLEDDRDRARRVGAPPARHRPRADGGHHPRRAAGRPPRAARGRPRDRVRALLRPLRLRGLRRPQAARGARVRPERRRGGGARGRALRRDHPLRQPVAHVVPLRAGAAPGARPTAATTSAFHFFIAFHPPLRQPTLLKYLAGPEIGGGNFVSDTSPEAKAAELRAQAPLHYRRA